MPVAHVQTIKKVDNSNTTTFTTDAMTVTAGNMLLIGILNYRNTGNAFAVEYARLDNINDGTHNFTNDISLEAITSGSISLRATLLSLANCPSTGSSTVTIKLLNTSVVCTFFWMEVSGVATSSYQDGSGASASGNTNAPSTGSYTTTNSDDFWVCLMNADSSSFTAGTGWTIPTNGSETGGSNLTGVIEYKQNPSTTSGTGNLGATTSGTDWVALGYAYKATASGANTPNVSEALTMGEAATPNLRSFVNITE